jgi:hypothetical protein
MMYGRSIAALGAVGIAALSATGVRMAANPTSVNVVVTFNGKVAARTVELDKLTATTATLRINRRGITTQTAGRTAEGVHVALQPGGQALHISASFARGRFKYVSYVTTMSGRRLFIELWKSSPPLAGSRVGFGDCLEIRSWHVNKGSVSAAGTSRDVFENTFQVVVRGANGKALGRRTVVHGSQWSTKIKYRASRRRAGTLEAVAFSPKDGALACLYETRVTLRAS